METSSPLLNPGEREELALYQGPGWLAGYGCEGWLTLELPDGLLWPYLLPADQLLSVEIAAPPAAPDGEWSCFVYTAGGVDQFTITVVIL